MDTILSLDSPAALLTERVGPKASRLARLRQAGLPVPDGFCLTADAYRAHLAATGMEAVARRIARSGSPEARRLTVALRLALLELPLGAEISGALVEAWRRLAPAVGLVAVRSSALLEDNPGATFAGQFESFLGVSSEAELVTAVRACWAALWATRALRYMGGHGVDPSTTAMAVLVQRFVSARIAGGALSPAADGEAVITATWGLGSALAEGEVVPDRYVLGRDGRLVRVEVGRKERLARCSLDGGLRVELVPPELIEAPCLDGDQAGALGRMVRAIERVFATATEVEWALGDEGIQILQARPLTPGTWGASTPGPPLAPGEHSGLTGQPAGIGRGSGPARVVLGEADLDRVEPGDVLVTRVAGPALAAVLSRVQAVVAELGGSTSHLAALARERGIPAVLGAAGATRRIPEGARVTVDGVTGMVRWPPQMR